MQKRILITPALTIFYHVNNAHHFPGISYIYLFFFFGKYKYILENYGVFCVFCLANFPLSTVFEYNVFERDNVIFWNLYT